jgi:hypothetical protein
MDFLDFSPARQRRLEKDRLGLARINQEDGPVNAVLPSRRAGPFEVLSVDPTGKRACVGCPCGGVHIFSTESLLDGSAACATLPLTGKQRKRMRAAIRERNELKETRTSMRDWKPGGRS